MSNSRPRSLLPVISDSPAPAAVKPGTSEPTTTAAASPAVIQTVWARVLLESLRRAGVQRAVISPGSRSTPFTLAAAHVGMVTENVRRFIETREHLQKDRPVLRINHVLMRSSVKGLEDFARLCVDLGAKFVVFVHVLPRNSGNPEYHAEKRKNGMQQILAERNDRGKTQRREKQ